MENDQMEPKASPQHRLGAIALALSLVVAGSLLTGCSNTQAKCDDLLNSLQYGAWSESDDAWYDANCR